MRVAIRISILILLGVSIGLVSWFGVLGHKSSASQNKGSKRPMLSTMPEIKSCVDHVKVIKAELKTDENGDQTVTIEVENKANVDITAVAIETRKDREKFEVVESGFSPDKAPQIIIPSHGRRTLQIGNLYVDAPIRVGSVMYANGEEEGCDSSLKTLHYTKDRDSKKIGEPQR